MKVESTPTERISVSVFNTDDGESANPAYLSTVAGKEREIFVELDVSSQAPAQSAKKPIGNLLTEFAQQSKLPFLPEWQLERFSSDVEALQNVPFENEKGQREPVSFFGLALEDLGQDNLNLVRSFSFVGDPTHSLDGDAPGSENTNLVSNNL